MMRRFRRLFGRAELTSEEVKMLRGVSRQTLWLAREAGLPIPAGPQGGEESGEDESTCAESDRDA